MAAKLLSQTARGYDEPFPGSKVTDIEAKCICNARNDGTSEAQWKTDQPLGVALSGGGIRSATFHIGVLQSLATGKHLPDIHYISAVSGGAYAATWVAKLILKEGMAGAEQSLTVLPGKKPSAAINRLRARASSYLTPRTGLLTPDTGLLVTTYIHNCLLTLIITFLLLMCFLSTPKIVLTLLRSIQYWPYLASIVAAALALGSAFGVILRLIINRNYPLVFALVRNRLGFFWGMGMAMICSGSFIADVTGRCDAAWIKCLTFALALILLFTPQRRVRDVVDKKFALSTLSAATVLGSLFYLVDVSGFFPMWRSGLSLAVLWARGVQLLWAKQRPSAHVRRAWVAIPSIVSGFIITAVFFFYTPKPRGISLDVTFPGFLIMSRQWGLTQHILFAVAVLISVLVLIQVLRPRVAARFSVPGPAKAVIASLGIVVLLYWAAYRSQHVFSFIVHLKRQLRSPAAFTPVLVFIAPSLIISGTFLVNLTLAIVGRIVSPYKRERITSLSSTIYGYTLFGWLLPATISVYGPIFLYEAGVRLLFVASGLWVTAVILGFSVHSKAPLGQGVLATAARVLSLLAPYVVFIGMAFAAAFVLDFTVLHLRWTGYSQYLTLLYGSYNIMYMPMVGISLGILAFLLSARFGINMSSMHMFYQARLSNAFLEEDLPGASPASKATADCALDENDTRLHRKYRLTHLEDFIPRKGGPYTGPYLLLNASVNLSGSRDLRYQERKATNFTFSPLFCGYEPEKRRREDKHLSTNGFVRTSTFSYEEDSGVRAAMALAISGSAFGSNMGQFTSARRRFLNTIFNLRLGWWLSNPRFQGAWQKAVSRARTTMLVAEFLGRVDDRGPFINLSDGGHFENVGLYELVRRKCKVIVISDASEDSGCEFVSLGTAIERCRVDFGATIELDVSAIEPRVPGGID